MVRALQFHILCSFLPLSQLNHYNMEAGVVEAAEEVAAAVVTAAAVEPVVVELVVVEPAVVEPAAVVTVGAEARAAEAAMADQLVEAAVAVVALARPAETSEQRVFTTLIPTLDRLSRNSRPVRRPISKSFINWPMAPAVS